MKGMIAINVSIIAKLQHEPLHNAMIDAQGQGS